MDAAGVPIDPTLISHGRFHVEEGIEKGRALLRLPDRPTAIFAGNDLQALGVYQAAREARLHIPEDLSVVGFDDLPVAQWVGPPLTTIRQPLVQMAMVATEMVLAMARGDTPVQTRVELATELVIRESTAPPRR
jgi:DNA-binding LacI/PurR family transcriptional regulator